jgi:thiamine transport system substrate-binding protein
VRALSLLLVAALLAGCTVGAPAPGSPTASKTVTVMTYSAFGVNKSIFTDFENLTGIHVALITQDDAGAVVNRAIATKDHPVADLLIGVDNSLISRAKTAGLFEPYNTTAAAYVPERYKADFRDAQRDLLAVPFDYGYMEMNVDAAWMQAHNVSLPVRFEQLADATYAPLTVVENPQTSTPGLGFLLATVAHFGQNGSYTYQDFWRDYAAHGGKISTSWDDAYGKVFTQGYDGTGSHDRPIVFSYSSSPAYNPMEGYGNATSQDLDLRDASWFQVEAMGVLAHAQNPAGARKLIDYLLNVDIQGEVAYDQVMYPVVAGASAPDAYLQYGPEPLEPAHLDADQIEAHREAWIAGWREATGSA